MKRNTFTLDHIMELSGGDTGFVVDVLEMFLEKATADLSECYKLVQEENWQEVKFLTHKLRSSAGSVGAVSTADQCAKLEQVLSETDIKTFIVNEYIVRLQSVSEEEIGQIHLAIQSLKENG